MACKEVGRLKGWKEAVPWHHCTQRMIAGMIVSGNIRRWPKSHRHRNYIILCIDVTLPADTATLDKATGDGETNHSHVMPVLVWPSFTNKLMKEELSTLNTLEYVSASILQSQLKKSRIKASIYTTDLKCNLWSVANHDGQPRLVTKSIHPKSDLNSKSKFCLSQAFPPDLET